jgi:hypothetical protein
MRRYLPHVGSQPASSAKDNPTPRARAGNYCWAGTEGADQAKLRLHNFDHDGRTWWLRDAMLRFIAMLCHAK